MDNNLIKKHWDGTIILVIFILICLLIFSLDGITSELDEKVLDWDKLRDAIKGYDVNPTEDNAKAILEIIPEEMPEKEYGNIDRALDYIIDESPRFLKHVVSGNSYLAEAAFRLYFIVLPGHVSEELHISLSRMLVKKPALYLSLLKKYKSQFPSYLEYPLLMTEILEIVPDINNEEDEKKMDLTEIALYKERIRALETVDNEEYLALKKECINILQAEIDKLKKQLK